MSEARIEQDWNHTAALLAMLINVNRDPKRGRAARASDFHPVLAARSAKAPPLKADLSVLRTVFVEGR